MKILEIINEEIVSRQANGGQRIYPNPEYNNGQRESIDLPNNIAKSLLEHPDYKFEVLFSSTSEKGEIAKLFFNGKEFLITVLYNHKQYFAHIDEEEYLNIKQRYERY
jgi:hypothetical protein